MKLTHHREARIGLLLCSAATSLLTGCQKPAAEVPPPRLVETVAAVSVNQLEPPPLVYAGVFRAESILQVTFPKMGRVVKIGPSTNQQWRNGDKVARGALLAVMENSAETAQVNAATARWTDAKAQHERDAALFASGNITRQQLDASANEFRAAEVALAQARALLEDLEVRAPFDGIVQRRNAALGEQVSAGTVVLALEDLSTMRFEARVPSSVSRRIRGNESATLLVGTERIKGQVDGLPFLAKPSDGLFTLRFRGALPAWVRPGASGRVELGGPSPDEARIGVPLSAITFAMTRDGRPSPAVFTVDPQGRLALRTVEVGDPIAEMVTIIGVEAGEQVVLRAGADLYAGMPVRPVKG